MEHSLPNSIHHCPSGRSLQLTELLDAICGFSPSTNSQCARCPACGESIELRLAKGRITLGYSYFGGSMHFEPVCEHPVAGLVVDPEGDDNVIKVSYGDRAWRFQGPAEVHEWMWIPEGAPAVGQSLAQLRLDEFKVRVATLQRNFDPTSPVRPIEITPEANTVIAANDRLWVAGPRSGLRLAFDRLRTASAGSRGVT